MKNSTRILYLEHGESIGGSTISLKELVTDAVRNGYECHVICNNEKIAQVFSQVGATPHIHTIVPFNHNTGYAYKLTFLDTLRWAKVMTMTLVSFVGILKTIRKVHPAIVHLNSSVLILYTPYFKFLNHRVIIHIRESIAKGYFGFRRRAIRNFSNWFADFIIYISEYEMALLQTRKDKSVVVYNYVHATEFGANDAKLPISKTPGKFTLVTLGGLAKIKGGDVVLEAVSMVDDYFELIVVGHPDPRISPDALRKIEGESYLKKILQILQYNGKSASIRFVGKVNDVSGYIKIADAVIAYGAVPHFPRTVFEAWLLRKPVVYFNSGYTSNIIDRTNVMIVEDESPSALAVAIRKLPESEYRRVDKLNDSEQIARMKFSENNFEQIDTIYQRLKSQTN